MEVVCIEYLCHQSWCNSASYGILTAIKNRQYIVDLIDKKQAETLGLKRFFTGIPCSKGHIAERTTSKNDCVACLYERQRKWNSKNAEKINKRSKKWYLENTTKAKETRNKWRELNAEKVRRDVEKYQSKNKDRLKNAQRIWAIENRDKVNSYAAKRRANQLRATPLWANIDKILNFYNEAARLTIQTGIVHHVDHIVPLQSKLVCGLHCEANLQILAATQNLSKSNRHWPDMPD